MHQDFLEVLRLVCQFPIILPKKLIGIMEINHFGGSVETLHYVLKQNVHYLLQKRQGGSLATEGRQQVCRAERKSHVLIFPMITFTPAARSGNFSLNLFDDDILLLLL